MIQTSFINFFLKISLNFFFPFVRHCCLFLMMLKSWISLESRDLFGPCGYIIACIIENASNLSSLWKSRLLSDHPLQNIMQVSLGYWFIQCAVKDILCINLNLLKFSDNGSGNQSSVRVECIQLRTICHELIKKRYAFPFCDGCCFHCLVSPQTEQFAQEMQLQQPLEKTAPLQP